MLLIDCPCMLLCAMLLSIFLMAGRAHHYDLWPCVVKFFLLDDDALFSVECSSLDFTQTHTDINTHTHFRHTDINTHTLEQLNIWGDVALQGRAVWHLFALFFLSHPSTVWQRAMCTGVQRQAGCGRLAVPYQVCKCVFLCVFVLFVFLAAHGLSSTFWIIPKKIGTFPHTFLYISISYVNLVLYPFPVLQSKDKYHMFLLVNITRTLHRRVLQNDLNSEFSRQTSIEEKKEVFSDQKCFFLSHSHPLTSSRSVECTFLHFWYRFILFRLISRIWAYLQETKIDEDDLKCAEGLNAWDYRPGKTCWLRNLSSFGITHGLIKPRDITRSKCKIYAWSWTFNDTWLTYNDKWLWTSEIWIVYREWNMACSYTCTYSFIQSGLTQANATCQDLWGRITASNV